MRGRGTLSLSVGHPFPIAHWPLGTTSKSSVSTEHRLTNSVREHPVGCEASVPQATARPQLLHTKPSYSAATQERETLPSCRPVYPLPELASQVYLIPGPTYRSRSSLRAGPSPIHLLATSHLSGFSSGPLDTSSSPLSCGKMAGVGMGQS